MAELLIPGPAGRIEARYTPPPTEGASVALILHPHPRAGGTMQDPITIRLYQMFERKGFGVLRFNTRGIGRSQGTYDQGIGELEDAAPVRRPVLARQVAERRVQQQVDPAEEKGL